jgi:hypothetical protein
MKKDSNQQKGLFGIFNRILDLLKLEVCTLPGKFNIIGTICIVGFTLAYFCFDVIKILINACTDLIKSCVLKQDIYHPYPEANGLIVLIIVVVSFLACLGFVYIHDIKKKSIS